MLVEVGIVLVLDLVLSDESTIGGIVLNEPEVGEVLDDIDITVDAPFLVRSADPVDLHLVLDIGSIVQCLCHIVESAPYEEPELAVTLFRAHRMIQSEPSVA